MADCLSSKYEKGIDASRWPSVITPLSLIFLSVPSWAPAGGPTSVGAHTVTRPTETRRLQFFMGSCSPDYGLGGRSTIDHVPLGRARVGTMLRPIDAPATRNTLPLTP